MRTTEPRSEAYEADRPRVKVFASLGVAALVGALVAQVVGFDSEEPPRAWTFEGESARPEHLGFSMPVPDGGAWALEEHGAAASGRVLVNGTGSGDRAALALVGGVRSADVRASTRCRAVEGEHRGCGLVFRLRDLDHHYVARVEAGGETVALALVRAGVEDVLGRAPAEAREGWHDLAVEAVGDRIQVSLDGAPLIEVVDGSLGDAGSAGLWAPARGAARFDAFAIEELSARGARRRAPGRSGGGSI